MGRKSEFLDDGHTLRSWAEQLDKRVYLAPAFKRDALEGSFEVATHTFTIDSAALFRALPAHIHLSPINSGNADRRPSRRGNWLYVPATASVQTFRNNRIRHGLVKNPDRRVLEVSLTCAIPPETLQQVVI